MYQITSRTGDPSTAKKAKYLNSPNIRVTEAL
jgi:hypothetical protein